MSRSGYADECDNDWAWVMWRGAVASAIHGRRGQAFLREMLAALDQLEQKRLIAHEFKTVEGVCALGAVGVARHRDDVMEHLHPEDYVRIAAEFGIAHALAQEIMYMNDEAGDSTRETPEARYNRMRQWIVQNLTPPNA